jgi:hypothetical protein
MKSTANAQPANPGEEPPALFPKPALPTPTPAQISETITPSLSRESFQVGEYEIPIQILPYAWEKKVALILDPLIVKIVDLLGGNEKKKEESEPDAKPKTILQILQERGMMALIVECADLVFGVLAVICQRYNKEISQQFLEETLNLNKALDIVMKQVEKNQIGDLVTSFFYKAAVLMPKMAPAAKAESPGN